MSTTAEYLSDLVSLKSDLAKAVSESGVEASEAEAFDTLIPKAAAATAYVKKYADETFVNALKGNACGNVVRLEDMSPIEHSLKISAESLNLLPNPYDSITSEYASVLENGSITFKTHERSGGVLKTFKLKAGTYSLVSALSVAEGSLGGYVNVSISEVGGAIGNVLAALKLDSTGFGVKTFTLEREAEIKVSYTLVSTPMADTDGNIVEWTANFYPMIVRGIYDAESFSFIAYRESVAGETVYQYGKNHFNKEKAKILVGFYGGSGTSVIKEHSDALIAYIPCMPNTQYAVSKIKTARFSVGCTTDIPKVGDSIYCVAANHDGTAITVKTNQKAKYLLIWFWLNSTSETVGVDEVLNSIQVEIGNTSTEYEACKEKTAVIDANGNANGLMSLAASTALTTFSPDILLEVEYNRDINKVIAEICEKLATATSQ